MEETVGNSKGIVNQGFTVEFSSEDENSTSDIDCNKKEASKLKRSSLNDKQNPTSGSGYELPENRSSLSTDATRNESFSSQLASETNTSQKISSSSTLHVSQEQGIITNNPNNSTRVDENVQTNVAIDKAPATSMFGVENFFPSQIVNGNLAHKSREVKKTSFGENNECNKETTTPTKEQLRLSLDATKATFTNGLPFHTNGKGNYDVQRDCHENKEDSDSFCDRCGRNVLTNYRTVFKYFVERPLFCFSLWAVLYIYWGDEALPGGSFFALTVLEIAALCLGYVAELFQFPGLLGMVAAGLILQNVPYIDVAKDLDPTLTSSLRGISIVILLIRGGLGVNPVNILKFKNVIIPLVIGSCVLEAVAATIAVYFIIGFPLEWASLMGCIISAMSGVAVLPYLASTEKELTAENNPYLLSPNYQRVIATARTACGMDAMIAICMAEVALGFIFAEGNVGDGVFKGIVELIIGGAFGIAWGFLAAFLLDDTSGNEKRVLAVFSGGVMSLIGMNKIGYPRGGPLATFLGTLIIGTVWKRKQIGGTNNEQLSATYTLIWFLFQPLLFSIIGARIDFSTVDWNVVTKGLICLAISLVVRFITSFCMTSWGDLEIRERIYLCLAWIPKGTVQAALGPAALDTASGSSDLKSPEEYADLAYKVMNISAATFIAAATIGCFCSRFIAPRLLYKNK